MIALIAPFALLFSLVLLGSKFSHVLWAASHMVGSPSDFQIVFLLFLIFFFYYAAFGGMELWWILAFAEN